MPTVEFIKVGRNKMTWQVDLPSTASEHMEHAIKQRGALLTVNMGYAIDFSDDDETKTSGKIMTMGLPNVVGEWRVVKP